MALASPLRAQNQRLFKACLRPWMIRTFQVTVFIFSSRTGADSARITHRGICTIEDATMLGKIFKQNRSRWCKDYTPWNLHYRRRDNAWRYFYQKIQKYRWRGRDWKRV